MLLNGSESFLPNNDNNTPTKLDFFIFLHISQGPGVFSHVESKGGMTGSMVQRSTKEPRHATGANRLGQLRRTEEGHQETRLSLPQGSLEKWGNDPSQKPISRISMKNMEESSQFPSPHKQALEELYVAIFCL